MDEVTPSPGDVIRALYESLAAGDVPGLLARLDQDVVVDEPAALPYGGVSKGQDVFVESILGAMMGYAKVEITDATVAETGGSTVVGILTGKLTAHSNGEEFPITMVEIHEVVGDTTRKIDVYFKEPAALAAFYERAGDGKD